MIEPTIAPVLSRAYVVAGAARIVIAQIVAINVVFFIACPFL
jgi:hypothetical protein